MTTVVCKQCSPPRSFDGPDVLAEHVRSAHPSAREPLWEDPPPRGLGKIAIALQEALAVLPQLRRNPGRWARLVEFEKQSTAFGRVKQLRKEHSDIEFEARGRADGSAIWARYVEEG